MIHRAAKYALRPTPAQAATLGQWIGATRFIYNLCLEQRRDFWRQYLRAHGRHLSWGQQSKEVTALRAEQPWIAAVPRSAVEAAVKDVDRAYRAWFSGRAGYPKPRRKFTHDTMRIQAQRFAIKQLNRKWSAMRLPTIGWIKFRDTGIALGRPVSITVAKTVDGWSASITHEVEAKLETPTAAAVGIDRGIAQTLTLSNGEVFAAPKLDSLMKRRKRAQRALARCKRGSNRRRVAKARVAVLSLRAAHVRADWCHRTSTTISKRFGLVAIEALKVQAMTARASGTLAEPGRNVAQKRGLNRAILDQCWGRFAQFLDYKMTVRGGTLISVPAAYTSQTCASCGVVDARSRKSQAVFHCVACDHTDNADVNAAKEILRRSTALLGGEGAHRAPAEPSIMAAA